MDRSPFERSLARTDGMDGRPCEQVYSPIASPRIVRIVSSDQRDNGPPSKPLQMCYDRFIDPHHQSPPLISASQSSLHPLSDRLSWPTPPLHSTLPLSVPLFHPLNLDNVENVFCCSVPSIFQSSSLSLPSSRTLHLFASESFGLQKARPSVRFSFYR